MKKLLFIVNVDWFFISHRLQIALEAAKNDFEVHIATTITDKHDFLEEKGFHVHSLSLHRSKKSAILLASEFLSIFSIIRKVNPDILHLVTIKPVLLGGIAARLIGIKAVVSAISGLGLTYIDNGFFAHISRTIISNLYRLALEHPNQIVIFQNIDDRSLLTKLASLSADRTALIPGSGINLTTYNIKPHPNGIPIVIFASRLLAAKGVREFVHAAEIVNKSKQYARFVLVGEIDPSNPDSLHQNELDNWEQNKIVELLGYRSNMEQILSLATIVVLPSFYGEGLPKILIEAAACGRAVITTDHPGCRDAIEKNITGLLVPVQDAKAVADAILELLKHPRRCKKMGEAGRKRAEKLFDIRLVVANHMRIYNNLLEKR